MASDGVILATPEYNNGIPGVFKNGIDWLSRPPADIPKVFWGRPFAIIGASPGGFGTILSQDAWLSVLRTLGARFWSGGRLMVSRATLLRMRDKRQRGYRAMGYSIRADVDPAGTVAAGLPLSRALQTRNQQ